MNRYADLRALRGLRRAHVKISARTQRGPGPDGSNLVTDVSITNVSHSRAVAFFLRADIRRGSAAGVPGPGDNQVLPAWWSDNDITLWPGESQTLAVSYRKADLHGRSPVITVSGWNVPSAAISAR
jgi:exo-1,4-beta-D-glucosaminidase